MFRLSPDEFFAAGSSEFKLIEKRAEPVTFVEGESFLVQELKIVRAIGTKRKINDLTMVFIALMF
jgi:hypothetical protein